MSKIQNENIKSEAELIADGGIKSQLPNDTKIYVTANGLNKTLNEAITDGDISGNANNLITNNEAKSNTSGWVVYRNTVDGVAPDNFGGTPNVDFTWTRNTTSPLNGVADFLMTKTANNRQGHGVYTEISIPNGLKTLMQLVSFLKLDSTNYADGYIGIFFVTSSDNFVSSFNVIRPNNQDMLAGITQVFKQIQLNSTDTKLRFCLHVATSTTTAWTVQFDNFFLGLSPVTTSAVVLDEKSYTPAFTGFGTPTGVSVKYSLVGEFAYIQAKLNAGTTTAVEARMTLPNNYISSSTYSTLEIVGVYGQANVSAISGYVGIEPSTGYLVFMLQNAGNGSLTKQNASAIFSSGVAISFNARVKIAGLSSNASSSIDLGARPVIVKGASNAGTAITANVTNITFTEVEDNTNSWDGSVFTAPETAEYNFSGFVNIIASLGADLRAYVDNTIDLLAHASPTANKNKGFNFNRKLNKGQTLSIRLTASTTLDVGATIHYINITKIASPQTIFQSERMAMRYSNSAGTTLPLATNTDIPFANLSYNDGFNYNTSTGVATMHRNGILVIGAKLTTASVAWTIGDNFTIFIYKNGSNVETFTNRVAGYTGTTSVSINAEISVNVNDTIKIVALSNKTTTLLASAENNVLTMSFK